MSQSESFPRPKPGKFSGCANKSLQTCHRVDLLWWAVHKKMMKDFWENHIMRLCEYEKAWETVCAITKFPSLMLCDPFRLFLSLPSMSSEALKEGYRNRFITDRAIDLVFCTYHANVRTQAYTHELCHEYFHVFVCEFTYNRMRHVTCMMRAMCSSCHESQHIMSACHTWLNERVMYERVMSPWHDVRYNGKAGKIILGPACTSAIVDGKVCVPYIRAMALLRVTGFNHMSLAVDGRYQCATHSL